jgi:hypothetical protein
MGITATLLRRGESVLGVLCTNRKIGKLFRKWLNHWFPPLLQE